jgi:hypothetical protein
MIYEGYMNTVDSFVWIMSNIKLLPSSRDIFIVLKELTGRSGSTLMNDEMIKSAFWDAVFESL